MPSFQLSVAVTLASSALLSFAVRGFSASKRGKIALPAALNDPLEHRHDPFDVTAPEDIIDGEPIDETRFWLNVRPFIRTLAHSVLYSSLDEATRDTSNHSPCRCRVSTNRLFGLCRFLFVLNDHSHIPAPCVICHLSLNSRGSVRGQNHDVFAYQEHCPPLHPYNTRVCAVGIYRVIST